MQTFESLIMDIVKNYLKTNFPSFKEELKEEIIEEFKGHVIEIPISEEKACEVLGCTPSTLAKYRTKKENPLPHIKGKPCKYIKSDIKKWLKSEKGIYKQP